MKKGMTEKKILDAHCASCPNEKMNYAEFIKDEERESYLNFEWWYNDMIDKVINNK